MEQEKEQLLTGQLEVKEAVNTTLRSMTGLEPQVEDHVENQVEKLAEAIHQLQQQIAYLEIHIVPDTP
jgi:proline dehydrogenase